MNLYIDITNKALKQGSTSSKTATTPVFTQGDTEPIYIYLMEDVGTDSYMIKEIAASDEIKVAIGTHGDSGIYAYCETFTLNTSANQIGLVLPLNTVQLDTAMGDSTSISAFLEVEYTSNGTVTTVLKTACTVNNDLISNDINLDLLSTTQLSSLVFQVYDEAGAAIEGETVTVKAVKSTTSAKVTLRVI